MGVSINSRKTVKAAVVALFILLTLVPPAYMFLTEFSTSDYASVFLSSRQLTIFSRTIVFGLGVAFTTLVLGTIMAFLLECTDLPFRKYFTTMTLIPLLIPPYISTLAWMMLLGKRGDLVSLKLPFSIYNMQSAILVMALAYFPLISLILAYAIRNVDFRLEEAARQVYSPITAFRKITLPLIAPHAIIGSLFVFILTVSEYGAPSMLQVRVYMTEIFAEFSAFFNMGNAIELSLPLLLLILFIILLIHYYLRGKSYVTISSFTRRRNVLELTRTQKFLGLGFIVTLLLFSAFIPLGVLLVMSQSKFLEALQTASDSIISSFWMACLGATLLTVMSFFLAYFYRKLSDPVVLLPLAVPSALMALGLIKVWNHPETTFIYGSFIMILLGYLARFLPFVVKTFSPFFEQIHPSVEETARISGASFTSIIRKIMIPLMKPAFIPVWAVGFILSLRELEVTLLVTPPGFQTLPNRIYTLLHYGDFELVSALCIIVVILIVLPLIVINLVRGVVRWLSLN